MKPTLQLKYIPNPFTETEGEITKIIDLEYLPNDEKTVYTVPHTKVNLPNSEVIEVVSELTEYGNRFTVRQNERRLLSAQGIGKLNLSFLTVSGFEVMVETGERQ